MPLSKDARVVAGRFVITAVQRKNLAEAWTLVGPAIRQDLTYKEWLSGNIPVVPFTAEISVAPIKVDFSSKDYALLEIILLPKSAQREIRDLHARDDQGREGREEALGGQQLGPAHPPDDSEQPQRLSRRAGARMSGRPEHEAR